MRRDLTVKCYDPPMLSSVALGELLTVAAVPAAVVVAMVAAMVAARSRRLAAGLLALALVLLVGMLVAGRRLTEPLVAARGRQVERFQPLRVGLDRARVKELLGPPDLVCPGEGAHYHETRATEVVRYGLFALTRERWIYFLPQEGGSGEPRPECRPLYADGEVGFNEAGKVLWFIELTDERFMTY